MCVLLITRLLRGVGRWVRNQVNHTSWVAVVTPTDRPKSVRNRCLIELFCGVVCVVTLSFWHFCWCTGFCHRTGSDLLLFVLEYTKSALKEKDSTDWTNELFDDRNTINGNKLRTYRKYKTQLFDILSYWKVVVNRSHRRILANFRSDALPLAIETSRYARPQISLEERKCNFCSRNCIENEINPFGWLWFIYRLDIWTIP